MSWALVPVKNLSRSKQRLGDVLCPEEREGLMLAMLQDVLTAISGAAGVQGILLVSRSAQVLAIAGQIGAELFVETAGGS